MNLYKTKRDAMFAKTVLFSAMLLVGSVETVLADEQLLLLFRPGDEATGTHRLEAVRSDGTSLKQNPIVVAPKQHIAIKVEDAQTPWPVEVWTVTDSREVRVSGGKHPRIEIRPTEHGSTVSVQIDREIQLVLTFTNSAGRHYTPALPAAGYDSTAKPFSQRAELTKIDGIAQGWSKARASQIPQEPGTKREIGPTRKMIRADGDPLYRVTVTLGP